MVMKSREKRKKEVFKNKLKYGNLYCENHYLKRTNFWGLAPWGQTATYICPNCHQENNAGHSVSMLPKALVADIKKDIVEALKEYGEKQKPDPQWYTEYNKKW